MNKLKDVKALHKKVYSFRKLITVAIFYFEKQQANERNKFRFINTEYID